MPSRNKGEQALRELVTRLERLREDERTRLSRQVHDELGQLLTALRIDIMAIKKRLPAGLRALRGKVGAMARLVDAAAETAHRIATELRPGLLDSLGLVPALEWQAEEFERQTGIRCVFEANGGEGELSGDLTTAVFRIVQEALSNVARHSGASSAEINFVRASDVLTLVIRDDGRGITLRQVAGADRVGLLGIRERVAQWRGDVAIEGRKGRGTSVTVRIPLTDERRSTQRGFAP